MVDELERTQNRKNSSSSSLVPSKWNKEENDKFNTEENSEYKDCIRKKKDVIDSLLVLISMLVELVGGKDIRSPPVCLFL